MWPRGWQVLLITLTCHQAVTEFNVALRSQRPYGLLGTGSPGRPPRLSHSSWALIIIIIGCLFCFVFVFCSVLLYIHGDRTYGPFGRGSPGRPPQSTFTQLLRSNKNKIKFSLVLLYVHRDRTYGLFGTMNPGRPPRLSHSSWGLIFFCIQFSVALRAQKPYRTYGLFGTMNPGRPLRLSHKLWENTPFRGALRPQKPYGL